MKRLILLWLVLCFHVVGASAQGLDATKLAALKAATALVLVEAPRGEGGSGSGFLFRKDGETAYFATNAHVVEVSPGNGRRVRVVLNSGIPNRERVLPAEVIGEDSSRDLAVLRVRGADLPEPLVSTTAPVVETTPIFVLGFPFGEDLATGRLHPAISITTGTVSSLRLDENGQLSFVQVDADINPGNSGGPVVTRDGELVGIATEKIDGTGVGLAIPPSQLSALLQGRVAGANFTPTGVQKGASNFDVSIRLIDPLGQVSKVAVFLIPQAQVRAPKRDELVKGALSPGMKSFPLAIENGAAKGKIALSSTGTEDVTYWQQIQLVSADGTEKWTQPVPIRVGFGGDAGAGQAPQNGDDWLGAATGATAGGVAPKSVASNRVLLGAPQALDGAKVSEIAVPAADVSPQMLFSRDGKHLYFFQNKRGLVKVALPSFQEERVLPFAETGASLAFCKSGIVAGLPGARELWLVNPATLEVSKRVKVPGITAFTACPALDSALVTFGEESLAVVDLAAGKVGATYGASGFTRELNEDGFREKVSVLEDFQFPTLSPDGKKFYCESFNRLQRFSFANNELAHESLGPEIGQNPQSIALSSDGAYIALLDGGGNLPVENAGRIGPYTTYVFKTGDLTQPVITIKSGAYPRHLAFDKPAARLYTHNREVALMVFTPGGVAEHEFKVPGGPNTFEAGEVNAILAHPDGHRVLVLTGAKLLWFELTHGN